MIHRMNLNREFPQSQERKSPAYFLCRDPVLVSGQEHNLPEFPDCKKDSPTGSLFRQIYQVEGVWVFVVAGSKTVLIGKYWRTGKRNVSILEIPLPFASLNGVGRNRTVTESKRRTLTDSESVSITNNLNLEFLLGEKRTKVLCNHFGSSSTHFNSPELGQKKPRTSRGLGKKIRGMRRLMNSLSLNFR